MAYKWTLEHNRQGGVNPFFFCGYVDCFHVDGYVCVTMYMCIFPINND